MLQELLLLLLLHLVQLHGGAAGPFRAALLLRNWLGIWVVVGEGGCRQGMDVGWGGIHR